MVLVGYGQGLFDIAIQETGAAEGVFSIMADNPVAVPDLNVVLVAGTVLQVKSAPTDKQVLKYFADNKLTPASDRSLIEEGEAPVILNVLGTEIMNVDGLTVLKNG